MSADLRTLLERSLGVDYRLERVLEGGGAAKVFLAYDVAAQRQVVVKVLPNELSGGVDRERFRREIHVATLLSHPRVVQVLKTGDAGEALYFTMPYIDGASLRQLIAKEHQLPLERALGLTRDIAEALEYAHSKNVVHRDIKPDNVLVDGVSGHALVTDFGIARAIDKAVDMASVTSTGLTLGTPTYMSPEQASAEKHIDGRSDIYSLGCVLYELLAGSPPFTGLNARVVIARHLNEPAPPIRVVRPDVPESIHLILERMLAKAPAARFPSAKALLAAIDAANVLAATPRNSAAQSGAAAVVQKRKVWALIGAGAVAVAGSVAAMLLVKGPKPPADAPGPDPKRIAVMYLDAPDADTALAAFGRGLTRDLIYALGQVPGLKLITENGVRKFGAHAAPDSIARVLNVATVIAGSLDRIRDSLQLDLRLVDARTLVEKGAVRARYPTAMLLTMRDSAVRELARQLLQPIGKEVQSYTWRSQTQSLDAWKLIQRGRDLVAYAEDLPPKPSDFGPQLRLLVSAQRLLDSAERADPKWSEPAIEEGWVELRRVQLTPSPGIRPLVDSLSARVRSIAERWPASTRMLELRGAVALERLKNSLETNGSLLDSAEADLRAATAADGSLSRAWVTLSLVLNRKGDSTGSILATRRALEADSYGRDVPRTMLSVVFRYLYGRQNDSARAYCAYARRRFPTDAYAQSCELTVLGWSGTGRAAVAEAWKELDHIERAGAFPLDAGMYPVGRYWVAAVLARTGLTDSARAVITATTAHLRAAEHAGQYPMNEAQVRVILGERDSALTLLGTAIKLDPAKRQMIKAMPWFDDLRRLPRFQQIVAGTVAP